MSMHAHRLDQYQPGFPECLCPALEPEGSPGFRDLAV